MTSHRFFQVLNNYRNFFKENKLIQGKCVSQTLLRDILTLQT